MTKNFWIYTLGTNRIRWCWDGNCDIETIRVACCNASTTMHEMGKTNFELDLLNRPQFIDQSHNHCTFCPGILSGFPTVIRQSKTLTRTSTHTVTHFQRAGRTGLKNTAKAQRQHRSNVKLAELVRARFCLSRGSRFDSGKKLQKLRTQIYIWAHRASSKATRLFLTK